MDAASFLNYKSMLAYMSAGTASVLNIIKYQLYLHGNIFQIIWKIIFLVPIIVIECVFLVIMFILSMIGKVIVMIPIIGFIYSIIFEIFHFISFLFGLIGNIASAKDFIEEYKFAYRMYYEDSICNY